MRDSVGLPEAGSRGYVLLVCLVAALGGLLFGYDTAVISGAIGFMQVRFGLDPAEVGWAASCALAGCVAGVAVTGALGDRIGRKKALVAAAVLFAASAAGTAVPRDLTEFIFWRIVGGVGVGIASMMSPLYIAEISPARVRGRLVTVNQFAIVIGMVGVYFVNYLIAGLGTEEWNVRSGWRWMFGSELAPALVFLVLLLAVPESPRWLARRERWEEAFDVLRRIHGDAEARRELAAIREAARPAARPLADLLQPGLRTALVIGITLAVLQQVTGINVFLYYAPEIFKKLGAATDAALLQTIVVGAVNLAFTVVAMGAVDRFGRRPLMMLGATGMGIALAALGLAAYHRRTETWTLVFVLGYIACFALSLGPVVWVVLSEIFPLRVRGPAMAIATFCLWSANYVVSQTFPMMDDHPWLRATFHGGFPFWLYAGLCAVTVWFVWRFVPETRGRSLEDLESLWRPPVAAGPDKQDPRGL